MTAAVSTTFPPAGHASPSVELQERALVLLRQELAACPDKSLAALLLHEIARLHERRDDLAAAARDELAATKQAAGFVEPVETLVSIALRSHSHSNLAKLLERLLRLAKSEDERLRAHLCLVTLFVEMGHDERALEQLETALEELPSEGSLWLALEILAEKKGDLELLRRASVGRAAHARGAELRSLILERVARLDQDSKESASALDFVKQSIDERPTWRALHAWETMAARSLDHAEAGLAATQIASVIRAAQAEPEEAPLYQVPAPELNEGRAFCAQVRALTYASRHTDWELAAERTEELLELWPAEPLVLLIAALVAQETENDALREVSLRTLMDHFGPSEDRAVLAASLWLSTTRQDNRSAAREALEQSAPDSLMARTLRNEQALDRVVSLLADDNSSAAVDSLIENIDDVFSASSTRSKAVFRALLLLARGNIDGALESLSATSEEPSVFEVGAALRHSLLQVAGQTRNISPSPISVAPGSSPTELDRCTRDWAQLRVEFQEQGYIGAERLASSPALRDEPFLRLLLGLLDPHRPAEEVIAEFPQEESPAEFREALSLLGKMLADPDAEKGPAVPSTLQSSALPSGALPSGPLLVGAALAQSALSESSSPRQLLDAAERIFDPQLGAGWAMQALFSALREKSAHDTELAFSALQRFDKRLALVPEQWLTALRVPDEPAAQLAYFESKRLKPLGGQDPTDPSTDPAADRRLDYLFLLHGLRREDLLFLARTAGQAQALTRAEQILVGLAASHCPEGYEYPRQAIASFESVLSDEEDKILAFAAPASPSDLYEQISDLGASALAASAGGDEEPSAASSDITYLFASWVAAKRREEPREEARALMRLALKMDDATLLSSVDSTQLDAEGCAHRKAFLQQRLESIRSEPTAENGHPPDGHASASRETEATLAWTLCEESQGLEQSSALNRLAQAIDPDLKDADSQIAALCAGYQHLIAENFTLAITCFEPLLAVLPSDLTLCQGLKIAAERTGRYDLEAEVTRELARHAQDSRSSSQLWERAGVLYQDHLGDNIQAEECFSAALAQNPGSPISFERLYRFARAKKDRARQLDLIEARLATAESETLVVELLWEKARHCRILGRADDALLAVEELGKLAADHLPSLALSAELYLIRGRQMEAAEVLKRITMHPDTPTAERKTTGFFCSDLFETLGQSRTALELLETLEAMGIHSNTSLLRKARSLAKSGDYGAAFEAFLSLNDQQDQLEERRESAQVLLALQRDHLKNPDLLKDAVRRVLRDDPLNEDALDVALGLVESAPISFDPEERKRMFAPARKRTLEALRNRPLDAGKMQLFASLCSECGDTTLERVAWGLLALTGNLTPDQKERLEELRAQCPVLPSHPWSAVDLDNLSAKGQLGAMRSYAETLAPKMAAALEPSLEGLGISSLMRVDEYSERPIRKQVAAWCSAFGIERFQLFIGGFDGEQVRVLNLEHPTILIGAEVPSPLSRIDCARLSAQLQSARLHSAVLLNQPLQTTMAWCEASRHVAEGTTAHGKNPQINEIARDLGHAISRTDRETLRGLLVDLNRARHDVRNLPDATLFGATRAAAVAYGDPSIVREIIELLPADPNRRNAVLSDLIRFCLSDHFASVRRRAGLEGG